MKVALVEKGGSPEFIRPLHIQVGVFRSGGATAFAGISIELISPVIAPSHDVYIVLVFVFQLID